MSSLYIICGLSFAGKTTLGHAIAARFGYEQVDVDCTKELLYGTGVADEELTREQWDTIYATTDARIVDLLNAGQTVIDASRNFQRAERDQIRNLIAKHGHQTLIIYVDTPESIARQRWQANRANLTRRDVSNADFEAIVHAWEAPMDDEQPLQFHFDEPIQEWIEAHAAMLVETRR